MTSFGTRQTAGAKPAFGKKTSPSPAGRSMPAPNDRLSPEAIAFLNAERARAPVQSALPSYATPKAAPASSVYGAGKPVWGRRIIAILIDSLIVGVPVFFFFGFGIFGAVAAAPSDATALMGVLMFSAILGITSIAYSVAMESSSKQATLGKMAVGVIVTDVHGVKPTLGAVLLRNTVGRFCSNIIPFYIGYLLGLFRADRRCLHDLIGGTMVRKRLPAGAPSGYSEVFA